MPSSRKQDAPVGTVTVDGQYATITFSRRMGHPPEDVWSAITDPEQLQGWYMTRAVIAGGKDGSIDFTSGPVPYHVTGRILSWDPPHLFEHEWNVDPSPGLPTGEESVVRWELERDGDGTLLTLTHRRLSRRTATRFAPGMHAFLDCLEVHLDGEPMPDWMGRVQEVRSYYPAEQPYPSVSGPSDQTNRTAGRDDTREDVP